MLIRILIKSIGGRSGRIGVAVLAVVLGASLVAALSTLSLALGGKVRQELRAYGANILVTPRAAAFQVGAGGLGFGEVAEEKYLSEDDLAALAPFEASGEVLGYAPFLYTTVEVEGEPVILGGTWFDQVRRVSPWWQVEGSWIEGREDGASVILGRQVAGRLKKGAGETIVLRHRDANRSLRVVGVVSTGEVEDDQIFTSLRVVQELTRRPGAIARLEVSAVAEKRPLTAIAKAIEETLPGAQARTLAQIAQGEGSILAKVELLMALVTGMVLLASAMVVMSTMTATVLERIQEIGLMKALGATNRRIVTLFLTEALLIALAGGVLGYGVGILLGGLIGQSVFETFLAPQPLAFPITMVIALGVTFLASLLPVRRAAAVDAAITLKGE